MTRALALFALVLSEGCSPAGCDGSALAFRTPTGPNHYVAAGGGGGTPTYVRASTYTDLVYGSTSPQTVAFTSNTAGNLILVGVALAYSANGPNPVSGITDSAGNTYAKLVGYGGYASPLSYLGWKEVWYAKNINGSAGTNTLSVAATGGSFDGNQHTIISALEYSGCSTSAPISSYNAQGYKDTSDNVNMTTGNFTSGAAVDLSWGNPDNSTIYGWTPQASGTTRGSPSQSPQWTEYAATGGTRALTGTTGSNVWSMIGLTLQ